MMVTLHKTNISHLGKRKNHRLNSALGKGYVSFPFGYSKGIFGNTKIAQQILPSPRCVCLFMPQWDPLFRVNVARQKFVHGDFGVSSGSWILLPVGSTGRLQRRLPRVPHGTKEVYSGWQKSRGAAACCMESNGYFPCCALWCEYL